MSHFTLGVVNVGGGECRGGECRTIQSMHCVATDLTIKSDIGEHSQFLFLEQSTIKSLLNNGEQCNL